MRVVLATAMLFLGAGCALDVNGLAPPIAAEVSKSDDAEAPSSSPQDAAPSLLTDAATSLYGRDQNSAQLACAPKCDGCCDRAGICHAGDSTKLCGLNGLACVDCSMGNFACNSAGLCEWDGGR